MNREDLEELHYMTPMSNVPSILEIGILSNIGASSLQHDSLAMEEIQELRRDKVVPQGRRLHEYVNLYFTARNPMMFKRLARKEEFCVLRIRPDVLEIPGVVITDQNAASDYVLWGTGASGLSKVNQALTFAEDWRDPDQIQYFIKKSAKQAEVLVPERVDPAFILGAWVCSENAMRSFKALRVECDVAVNSHLFFQGDA